MLNRKSEFNCKFAVFLLLLFCPQTSFSSAVVVPFTTIGLSSFMVPSGVSVITVKLWGAGGASTSAVSNMNGVSFAGGSGAFISCNMAVNPGSNVNMLVGQGGRTCVYGGNSSTALGGGGSHLHLMITSTSSSPHHNYNHFHYTLY